MIQAAQARLSRDEDCFGALSGPRTGAEPGEDLDLHGCEGEAGRLGVLAVAGLDELQGDGGGLGGDGGEFEQAIGGLEPAVFDLETLALHETEELLDRPAFLVPSDDAPGRGGIADLMSRQEAPMQRLDTGRRRDSTTSIKVRRPSRAMRARALGSPDGPRPKRSASRAFRAGRLARAISSTLERRRWGMRRPPHTGSGRRQGAVVHRAGQEMEIRAETLAHLA